MHPALTLSGFGPIPAYELMLALGACLLVSVLAGSAARQNLDRRRVFAWLAFSCFAAVAGARLAFAASRLPSGSAALAALAETAAAGFSSLGGAALGGLAAWWIGRRLLLPLDTLAGPLALGACLFGACARVGCFLAGCCHGVPTGVAWAVVSPDFAPAARLYGAGTAVHPLPLYEAALLLAIAAGLASKRARGPLRALAAGGAYLAGRFALEFLRGDVVRHDGLSATQWLALVLVASAAVAVAARTIVGRGGIRRPSKVYG